jgi:DNA-binding protein HU-beta
MLYSFTAVSCEAALQAQQYQVGDEKRRVLIVVRRIFTMATTKSESTIVGRQELTKRIAAQADLTQKKASEVLEALLDGIREELQSGHEVRLVGFGSFKVKRSAARKGVNPRNRQTIEVPAKDRVRFSPGKELAEAVIK